MGVFRNAWASFDEDGWVILTLGSRTSDASPRPRERARERRDLTTRVCDRVGQASPIGASIHPCIDKVRG